MSHDSINFMNAKDPYKHAMNYYHYTHNKHDRCA